MPTAVIPLIVPPSQRSTGTTGGRIVNGLIEPIANPILREVTAYVVKRPGLANHTQPTGGSATGRGIYAWQATGSLYSVFNNLIYSGTTDLGAALAASSGRVWFTETPATAAAQLLIASDGTDNYNITTGDVDTQIDETDDANYPTPNLGPVFYFDGYLVQGTTTHLVNGELNSTTSWLAADTKTLDRHGDALEALHWQKDQIVCLGKNTIEFFYNVGKPTGSPFQRIEQNSMDFGIATRNSLAWSGETMAFVGENSSRGDGGRSIWMIQGLQRIQEISQTPLNRFLAAEGSSISSATAFCERLSGQLCYVLNLSSADRSFCYSFDNGMWTEFQSAAGGRFPVISSASLNGTIYGQDASNGRVYTISPTTYQDSGSAFSLIVQTDDRDEGTQRLKHCQDIELLADTQTSGTTTLEKSDDRGATYQTVGTFDNTAQRKVIYRFNGHGSYSGARIWRLTNSDNTAWRGQALRLNYKLGRT